MTGSPEINESQATKVKVLEVQLRAMAKQVDETHQRVSKILDRFSDDRGDLQTLDQLAKELLRRMAETASKQADAEDRIAQCEIAIAGYSASQNTLKWAFNIFWGVFVAVMAFAFTAIYNTHEIAITNQTTLAQYTRYPEDVRK